MSKSYHVQYGASLRGLVIRNTIALLTGRAANLLLSALSSIVLVRYLGSERLGEYGALYAYVMLFSWLAAFGVEGILGREAARRRSEAGSIIFTGMVLTAATSVLAGALVFVTAPWFGYSDDTRWLLLMVAAELLLLVPVRLPMVVLQVDLKQWHVVRIGILRQVLWLSLLLLLARLQAALAWVVFSRLLCGVVETMLLWSASVPRLARPWRLVRGEVGSILTASLPIAISALAAGVYTRVDQVILHNLVNATELGEYVAGITLTEAVSLLPSALMLSVAPILAQCAHDEVRFNRYVNSCFRCLSAVALGVCLLVTLTAPWIIRLLYGAQYKQTAQLLSVLIWSQPFIFLSTVFGAALVAKNLQSFLVIPPLSGAAISVILNSTLVPRFGALGAALASVVSYAVALVFVLMLFRKARGLVLQGLRVALVTGMAAIAMALIGVWMPMPMVANLPIALAGYALLLWWTGVIRRQDFVGIGDVLTYGRSAAR